MIGLFNTSGRCVFVVEGPDKDETLTQVPLTEEQKDWALGGWTLVLEGGVVKRDPSQALAALRAKRNELLRDSDWVETSRKLLPAQKAAGLAYRDALFDLPETVEDVWNPVWPSAPSFIGSV